MTPNETLRAMLDERGVDWDYGITGATTTRFSVNGIDLTFTPMRDGLVCSTILTPEKVIAATLGRGMLTADDVRDLIERHSYASGGNGRDFHNGAYAAIADELNNMLGSCSCTNGERTNAVCNPITYDNGYSTDHLEPGEYHEFWEPACACGNCGELIPMRKFCPNCGARIEVWTHEHDKRPD